MFKQVFIEREDEYHRIMVTVKLYLKEFRATAENLLAKLGPGWRTCADLILWT
jgi:hypothetical protein